MAMALPFLKLAAPYLSIGSSVLGAFGAIRQGQQQAEMYELQGQQAKLKAGREQLQYEQQANQSMNRLFQTNATAAARGFAGGVSGFSGSAALVQTTNAKRAGKEIGVLQESGKAAKSFGDIQASMFEEAADNAITSSYFDAIGNIGMAAFSYSQIATGGVSGAKAAGISSFSPATNLDPIYKSGVQLPRYQ
jgi:hypothetical protein